MLAGNEKHQSVGYNVQVQSSFLPSLLCLPHHLPPPFLSPCLAAYLASDLRINRFFIMSSRRGQGQTIGWCEIKRCPEEAHKCVHTHTLCRTHAEGKVKALVRAGIIYTMPRCVHPVHHVHPHIHSVS